MDGRKHSLNLIGPGRGQSQPVIFFYNTYRFENIIHISFYKFEIQKIYICTKPTLVLTWVCQTWVMHHVDTPTTLPELTSPKQPRWSETSLPICDLYHRSFIGARSTI